MLHTASAVAAANSEQSPQPPSKAGDNTTAASTSPSNSKRPRSEVPSTAELHGRKRRNSNDQEQQENEALNMFVDVDGDHRLNEAGIERNGHNWAVENGSFEQTQPEDALNMDDILPTEGGAQWLLDLDENVMLNDGTQYLQLQETEGSPALQTDATTLALLHHTDNSDLDLNLEPSIVNLREQKMELDTARGDIIGENTTTINKSNDNGETNRKIEVQIATTLKPSPLIPQQMPGVQWGQLQPSPSLDVYANVQAPDIETRIIAPPPSKSAPQSSAIRIAPRDQSKFAVTPIASHSASAGSRSESRRKRTRYSPNQSSPSPPPVAPAPISHYPVGSPNIPQPSMQGNVAYPIVPHPMAAPLLFAQGFPGAPIQGALGEHRNNPRFAQQHQQQKPNSGSFKPAATANMDASSNGNIPVFSPPQPGMMPVDPTTLMHMAQQMWMAAMAASGNSPHAQSRHHLNQPRISGPPTLNVPGAGSGLPPMPVGEPSNKGNATMPTPIAQQQHGGAKPIFIRDDGKHVVVEQQAPAKLTRHPVLGRLQLQSKQQAAIELSNTEGGHREKSEGTTDTAKPVPGSSSASSKERRKRLVWTPELHERFVQAISAVGLHQAVPKTLVQIMNVDGLTTEHVKSHLQKYRSSLKKTQSDDKGDKDKLAEAGGVIIKLTGKSSDGEKNAREVHVLPNRTPVATKNSTAVAPPAAVVATAPDLKAVVPNARETSDQSGPPSDDVRLQLQERTMQLQYELQVMVHRTVTLQKELQVSIEEQSESKKRENQPQMATSRPAVEEKEKKESGYIEQMAELDRETKRVRHELGMIQQRLSKGDRNQEYQTGKG